MFKFNWKNLVLTAGLSFSLVAAGCSGTENAESDHNDKTSNGQQAEEKKELELAYVAWDSEIASTNVIEEVLERNGYEVELTQVTAQAMWQAVAEGGADAMVAAWLPGTHKKYYNDFEGQFEDLGANLEGAKIGLVTPSYVEAETIGDLANSELADTLNETITGIDAGAGVVQAAEQSIEDYALDGWSVQTSSSAAMTQALADAIEDQEPIVVTGWTPHWKFAKYDLKYLKDPKGSFGGEEKIHTIVRKGLKEDMPGAYKILDQFNWTPADMESVMLKVNEGTKVDVAAKEWVDNHPEKVKEWTQGVNK